MEQYVFFSSFKVILLAYFFGKMAPVTAITYAIYLWSSTIYNALLHASGHFQYYKIEEQINFALSDARLYLSESYDELDEKSAAANTFDISCGGGGSRSSL